MKKQQIAKLYLERAMKALGHEEELLEGMSNADIGKWLVLLADGLPEDAEQDIPCPELEVGQKTIPVEVYNKMVDFVAAMGRDAYWELDESGEWIPDHHDWRSNLSRAKKILTDLGIDADNRIGIEEDEDEE